jgi:hypothetical protein
MAEPSPVYLFRSEAIAPGSSTIVCAAPAHLVVSAYGGGGHLDHEGVQRAFGGYAFYRGDETRETFLAVWGARNASRFRTALRNRGPITIMREPPPVRLTWLCRNGERPPTSEQHGTG